MVISTNPSVAFVQENWGVVMAHHAFYGLFFWEFFTTLGYEWKVIWGCIPFRWTIWIYSVSRVACLMSLILNTIRMNVTVPIHCQLWTSFELLFDFLALAAASLLIVLRITAIWKRNKVAVTVSIGVWVMNFGFLIQGAAHHHSVWDPTSVFCVLYVSLSDRLVLISMAATDIILLFIMLLGLFRMRHDGNGTFGLARLLWKQGVIWIALATAVEIPPAVSAIMNLFVPTNVVTYLLSIGSPKFQIPAIVTMTIAATRMHRSLVDFATPDITHSNFQISGLKFAKNKESRASGATPVPLNSTERSVCIVLQRHPTRQMSDHGLSTNMDEGVDEEPNGSTH